MSDVFSKFVFAKAIAVLLLISLGSCFGQENPKEKQKKPESSKGLTPEQSNTIKKILSAYTPSRLTSEDAKSIQNKFREAGIHAGPENNNVLKELGFDPEKLRDLSPPPESGKKENQNPPPQQARLKVVDEKICKTLLLTSAQREIVLSAFSEFYSDMDKLMQTQGGRPGPLEKSKVDPLGNARNLKVKQVVTEEQFKKFLELELKARPEKPGRNE